MSSETYSVVLHARASRKSKNNEKGAGGEMVEEGEQERNGIEKNERRIPYTFQRTE